MPYIALRNITGFIFVATLIIQVFFIFTLEDRFVGHADDQAQTILGLVLAPAYLAAVSAFLASTLTKKNVAAKRIPWSFGVAILLLVLAYCLGMLWLIYRFKVTPEYRWTDLAASFGFLSCTIGIVVLACQKIIFPE